MSSLSMVSRSWTTAVSLVLHKHEWRMYDSDAADIHSSLWSRGYLTTNHTFMPLCVCVLICFKWFRQWMNRTVRSFSSTCRKLGARQSLRKLSIWRIRFDIFDTSSQQRETSLFTTFYFVLLLCFDIIIHFLSYTKLKGIHFFRYFYTQLDN